ncbi:MAG: dTDP-4-dehydrorhamnose 3,5-epimerase [Limnobacter sp.]|nr:dTDP-4-dehydrorhamnose 3,5-epimerase [Limnobacter sp.]
MKANETKLAGVYLLEPSVFGDARGYFFESFNNKKFESLTGFLPHFVQDNQSKSSKGVLRGLHYQVTPKAQGKLVRVVKGAVFDVAVDIRPDSPTFGQWEGVELSEDNHAQLWIPPGLAHGFVTLTDEAIFQYKVTDYWSKDHEKCLKWNDPELKIDWGFEGEPLVSPKDAEGQSFADFKHELLNTISQNIQVK